MRERDGPGLEQVVKIHNRGALAAYMECIATHPNEDQVVKHIPTSGRPSAAVWMSILRCWAPAPNRHWQTLLQ